MLYLDELYSCRYCNFVKRTIGLDKLKLEDEKEYLFHLKTLHGIEP